MFAGIVHAARPIVGLELGAASGKITIDLGAELCQDLSVGASVSVDGVCLTATTIEDTKVAFDVIWGTLDRTILPKYSIGRYVNIERSLSQGDEIGGHEVSGHVDCRGVVSSVEIGNNNTCLTISLDSNWVRYLFPHGFITLNGVSLTISDIDKDLSRFNIWLIPETLRRTNLSQLSSGDMVNIEVHRGVQVLVDTINDAVERVIMNAIADGRLSGESLGPLLSQTRSLLQGSPTKPYLEKKDSDQ